MVVHFLAAGLAFLAFFFGAGAAAALAAIARGEVEMELKESCVDDGAQPLQLSLARNAQEGVANAQHLCSMSTV